MVRLNPDEHGTMCGCHVQTFSTETNHFYSLLGKFHSMNQGYNHLAFQPIPMTNTTRISTVLIPTLSAWV